MIQIDEQDLILVKKILRAFLPEPRKIVAFGSRVTGVHLKRHSDLDLCIMGDVPLSSRDLSDLHDAFTNSNLTMRVDVVDWAATSPSFQAIIQKNCEEITL